MPERYNTGFRCSKIRKQNYAGINFQNRDVFFNYKIPVTRDKMRASLTGRNFLFSEKQGRGVYQEGRKYAGLLIIRLPAAWFSTFPPAI